MVPEQVLANVGYQHEPGPVLVPSYLLEAMPEKNIDKLARKGFNRTGGNTAGRMGGVAMR